jgi:hypothetical protein
MTRRVRPVVQHVAEVVVPCSLDRRRGEEVVCLRLEKGRGFVYWYDDSGQVLQYQWV